MSANSYRGTDQCRHVINTNITDAMQKKSFLAYFSWMTFEHIPI
jgi:hypothetical protein